MKIDFIQEAFEFSRFFTHLIGVISMTESNEFVRVGYLSFWGRRRNKIMKLEDVMPLRDCNVDLTNKIVHLKQYSMYVFCLSKVTFI